jgi:hypothetical protein
VSRFVELEDVETSQPVLVDERIIRARVWRANGSTHLLREYSDFDVLPDGTLDLSKGVSNGNAPADGDRLMIKYTMNPAWVVIGLEPQYFREKRDQFHPHDGDLIEYPRSLLVGVDFLVKPEDDE